jgi:hypothetical protein
MRRRLWRAAAYALGVLAFVTVGLELACRWGLVPNAASTLRKRAQAPATHGRLLLMGDSFSVEAPGDPGALTLGNQLQQRFSARGTQVVNLSVQGYGPADELDALRLFAADNPGYRPDVVALDYFVGNDLSDTLFRLRGGLSRVGLLRYRGGEWLQRSWLLRVVMDWFHQRQLDADARRIRRTQMGLLLAAPLPAVHQALNPYLVDLAHVLPDFLLVNLLMEGRGAELAWQENQRILRQIRDYATDHGARLVINILPQTLQVNDSHYSFFKELGFRVDPRMLETNEPQTRMLAFCAGEKIICNDLLPDFRGHGGEALYLPGDDHWLTAGHTLAADGIEKQLIPLLNKGP